MNITVIICTFIILLSLELVYFRIADKFNIIDRPNHRSSHSQITLRGGGIIFAIALLINPLYFGLNYSYFLIGLALIASVSFMDDVNPVSNKLRICIHLIAVGFMFSQLGLFGLPFYWILVALFIVIGSINAINFMDGINGITGAYSFVALSTLLYINIYITPFIASSFIVSAILSVLVFNVFNFRRRAKCFAGDVGSVSIAFIIIFFLFSLIIKSLNFNYILLLLVYGTDSVTTIIFRIIKRENIFDPHRSHFYQYWANERKVSHLLIATLYALVQVFINILTIFYLADSVFYLFLVVVSSTIIFVAVRFAVEGSQKLLGN